MVSWDLGLFGLIADIISLSFIIGVSLLISQPLTGALVRLRANYLPRALSLDSVLEDGSGSSTTPQAITSYLLRDARQSAKIGPVVSGVIEMLRRTHRLEGWAGVYKGAAPVAIQLATLAVLSGVLFDGNGMGGAAGGAYRSAPSGPQQFAFWSNVFFMCLVSAVTLPLNVITVRTIVHPRPLPLHTPRANLRELLSHSEYSRPWRLYRVPGLLPTTLAHVAWIGLATRLVRHLLVPALGGLPPAVPAGRDDTTYEGPIDDDLTPGTFGLLLFLAWNIASVVVLSPLEVIQVRLAVQRPESQQPLHIAFAGAGRRGAQLNPASHQARANAAGVAGGYSDADAAGAKKNDKPLPSQPAADSTANAAPTEAEAAALPRPSFAIEDEEASDEEGEATSKPKPTPTAASSARPTLAALDAASTPPQPQPQQQQQHTFPLPLSTPPPEPVIALRPCDQPLTASAAHAAAEQGFGAPIVERYVGFVDCLNKLVDEEGAESLYRGAVVTLLGALVGGFGA